MAEKVVEEYYLCKFKHGHRHSTEAEADTCSQETELSIRVEAIEDNPDFVNTSHEYEDFDANDCEVNFGPSDAQSIDQVQSVTIIARGKVTVVDVFERKTS